MTICHSRSPKITRWILMARYILTLFLSLLFRSQADAYLQTDTTPPLNYIKIIEEEPVLCGMDPIDCVYVINLDWRQEKFEQVKRLFDERGIPFNRFSAIDGWKFPKRLKRKCLALTLLGCRAGRWAAF